MFVNSAENIYYSFYFEQICIKDLEINAQLLKQWLFTILSLIC